MHEWYRQTLFLVVIEKNELLSLNELWLFTFSKPPAPWGFFGAGTVVLAAAYTYARREDSIVTCAVAFLCVFC